jgi:fructokinase
MSNCGIRAAMGRIVALGEVVADIYRSESENPAELPFVAHPGGAPANLAVAAAKLGSEAAFIGRVGDDLFGDFILRALESGGVDVSGVGRCEPPTRTSIAFVEVAADGAREFTFYRTSPAADELLAPEDVARDPLSGASFVTFGSIPLLREPSRAAVHRAVELARELNVPVAFDVNLREHLWESVAAAKAEVLPLFERAEVLKLSDDETETLLGVSEPEAAADRLLEGGVSLVFVTLGVRGAFYATPEFRGTVPAFPVEVVDTTGAGDAFTGAALAHLAGSGPDGWSEERVREAAVRGAATGALVCTAFGAMGALPTAAEVEEFLSSAAPG